MATRKFTQVAYGLSQPLINENPQFIYAKRSPNTSDFSTPSTIWINSVTSTIYILAVVANNSATWVQVQAGGGAGVFSSLTVTPGPISLTGTTTINTAGAAVTTIGTGGTGVVNIGNATGNTLVTGSLGTTTSLVAGTFVSAGTTVAATTTVTAGTGLIATTGGVTAAAGNIVATTGNITATAGNVTLGNAASAVVFTAAAGIKIIAGAGSPNGAVVAPIGSLFLATNGSGVADRAFINTDGAMAWTAITTAS